jgi:hypothetical protein
LAWQTWKIRNPVIGRSLFGVCIQWVKLVSNPDESEREEQCGGDSTEERGFRIHELHDGIRGMWNELPEHPILE